MAEIMQWADWLELIAIDEPSEKRATNFRMVATLIHQQQARIAELDGLVNAQGVGHVTRTWRNESGHYCMEIIPDSDFFARYAPPKASVEQEPSAG